MEVAIAISVFITGDLILWKGMEDNQGDEQKVDKTSL